MDILLKSGIVGLLVVLSFLVLLVGGLLAVSLTRSRRVLKLFAMLALLPAVLGWCGTLLGERQIHSAVEEGIVQVSDRPDSQYRVARDEARNPLRLGLMATATLGLAAACCIPLTRGKTPPDLASRR